MTGAMLAAAAAGRVTPLSVALSAGANPVFTGTTQTSHDYGNNLATVSGGSGSYTYAWTGSGGSGIWSIGSPSLSSTDVRTSGQGGGLDIFHVTCAVTDTVTGRTASAQSNYHFTNTN